MEWARREWWLGGSERYSLLGFPTKLFMLLKLPCFCSPKAQGVGTPNISRCQ